MVVPGAGVAGIRWAGGFLAVFVLSECLCDCTVGEVVGDIIGAGGVGILGRREGGRGVSLGGNLRCLGFYVFVTDSSLLGGFLELLGLCWGILAARGILETGIKKSP